MDIRQTEGWANYLRSIHWQVKKIGNTQIFIRRIPLFNFSFIKIQHQTNPPPFKKIDQLARDTRAVMVLIEPLLKNYHENLFIKNGYQKTMQPVVYSATRQIDLSPSLNKIYLSFAESARRNIKKSKSYNLKIRIVFVKKEPDLSQFEKFMKLVRNLTAMKKFYIPGGDEMDKKVTGLKDSLLIFVYEKNIKDPIAAVWVAMTKDSSHYIQTGITKRGYELLANYLMVWEIIRISKALRLKTFDFEGIYDPRYPKLHQRWRNFSEFKSRFHGNKIEYPTSWVKFYNIFFEIFYILGSKLP